MEIQLFSGCPPAARSVRAFISPAALLVNVTARIASEGDALVQDQVGDAVGDDAGLAAARAGQDQDGAVGGQHRLALLRVQPLEQRRLGGVRSASYSTVTDLARLRGWSTSRPARTATWYARAAGAGP